MLGLLGWDPYLKTVIAVDDDVDITNDQEVLWALATRFQPAQDLFIVDGLPGSALDPHLRRSGLLHGWALTPPGARASKGRGSSCRIPRSKERAGSLPESRS